MKKKLNRRGAKAAMINAKVGGQIFAFSLAPLRLCGLKPDLHSKIPRPIFAQTFN
jgi:hypothetical protein